MALFGIADLHLSLKVDKPMDVFGGEWENYINKIAENWQKTVGENDTVVIPGDISWATYMEDAAEDFRFLSSLNGKKLILKGNHDYWFETASKLEGFFKEEEIDNIKLIHNSYEAYEDIAICGTKGADITKPPQSANAAKIEKREAARLEASIQKARDDGYGKIIVFLHYPPVVRFGAYNKNPFTDILEKHGIKKCFYGHLHSRSHKIAFCEQLNGVEYRLISADFINFTPFPIKT